MNNFERSPLNLLASFPFWVLFAPRLGAGGVSKPPGEQQAEQLQRLVNAIQAVFDGVVFVVTHAAGVAAHVVAVAALPLAIMWLVIKAAGPLVHRKLWETRMAGVRIVPPAESLYEPARWVAVHRMLYSIALNRWRRAIVGQPWLAFELEARNGQLTASCWFPKDFQTVVVAALRSSLPDADIVPAEVRPPLGGIPAARARLRLWREDLYTLGEPRTDALASAAEALAAGGDGVIQIAMAPDTGWEARAAKRLDQVTGIDRHESLISKLIRMPMEMLYEFWFSHPESDMASAPRRRHDRPLPTGHKSGQACWRVEVRLCCWAPRMQVAIASLKPMVAAFYTAEGENRLRPETVLWTRGFDHAVQKRLGPGRTSMVLSPEELAQLVHLPLASVGMESARVRVMPRRRSASGGGGGSSIFCQLDNEPATPVAISQADWRHHAHVLGPTGVGKSTLLLNLALQDIEAGIGVGLVDPKGDLVRELLERIPPQYSDRIVLIDPSIRERPVGLNVLECNDPIQRELVTDSVVTIFRKTFERFWGPRTDDVLRAALLTLLRHPGATLTEVPFLLLNPRVRSRLTKNLGDPIGLKPFWQEYEAQTEGQRLQMVGPVLNKLRTFLLRPTVRNVLGQSKSTIDLHEVLDRQGILLVNLAKGELGEETSRLLGAFVMSRMWQAALARSSRPERWRPDFNLYLDEFHDYLHLPQSIDDILAQARAYHLSLTLANQHLAQLHDSTRQALASNARTRIVFQLGPDDARLVARDFEPMTVHQLQSLARFQIAVRLNVDGHTEPPFTGTTLPMPSGFGEGHAAELKFASVHRYGRPVAEVEAEIVARLNRIGAAGGFKEIA